MTEKAPPRFDTLLRVIKEARHLCWRGSSTHAFLSSVAEECALRSGFARSAPEVFGTFGELLFPFEEMGSITSLDLFGLDELILFSFYHDGQERYRKFADLGANLGLHTILGAKLGWSVTAFEPDPRIFEKLEMNCRENKVDVELKNLAVAADYGLSKFTRLHGNLTGSHLKGRKSKVYGRTDEIEVLTVPFHEVLQSHDLVKIDVEGAEAELICSSTEPQWRNTDAFMEISSSASAEQVWQHISPWKGFSLWAQKTGWSRVTQATELPHHHSEGSVFLTASSKPWWSAGEKP